ncbi:hypothetical protein D3C85_1254180 [compost metagenome]
MAQQVQLEVGLRGGRQLGVFSQQGGNQRLVALGQAGQQGSLGSVDAFEGFGQLRGLGGAERDGLIAFGVAQDRCDSGEDFSRWLEYRGGVEHFQPCALTVLSADAEGQAEQGSGHVNTSNKIERAAYLSAAA